MVRQKNPRAQAAQGQIGVAAKTRSGRGEHSPSESSLATTWAVLAPPSQPRAWRHGAARDVPLYLDDCDMVEQMLVLFGKPRDVGTVVSRVGDLDRGPFVAAVLLAQGLLRRLDDHDMTPLGDETVLLLACSLDHDSVEVAAW